MKNIFKIFVAMMSVALFSSSALADKMVDLTDGKTLKEFVTKTSPYWSWELWPHKGKLYKGMHPHGAWLTTYLNDAAFESVRDKGKVFREESIIVKENYKPDKSLAAVTVMVKKKGYNPAAGDWYWLKYNADGKIEKQGKVGGCVSCHGAKKSNDWVFTGPVSNMMMDK